MRPFVRDLDRLRPVPYLCHFDAHFTTFHKLCVAVEHFELGSLTLAPETDIEFVPAYAKIANRYVRQPLWEQRIDIQFVPWRVGQEPQHGLGQHEDRSGRPGLRHIRADILHRKRRLIAWKGSVELRQLVQQKMTRSDADVMRDPPGLRAEAIELEPHPVHMSGAIRRSTTILARSRGTMPDQRQWPAFEATVRTFFLSPSSA